MSLPILPKKYKTREAAAYLHISRKTLLKCCAEHRIGYHRYKGGFVFHQSDLDSFERRNYIPATTRKAA